MTRRPVLSGRDVVRALRRIGFVVVGRKGSHLRLKSRRQGRTCVVIVPDHREVAPGTLSSILRQAALSRKEFMDLL